VAGNISGYQCGNCNNARNVRINSVRGDQARRLDTGELDAASAAFKVGYESPSQFNREYGRFFGRSPIRDIKPLRDGKVVAITTALRGIAGSLSSHLTCGSCSAHGCLVNRERSAMGYLSGKRLFVHLEGRLVNTRLVGTDGSTRRPIPRVLDAVIFRSR
jgi:hypothetical protein